MPNDNLHNAEIAYYAAIRAGHNWHTVAGKAMRVLAFKGEPFSADDLREMMDGQQQPAQKNAIGGLFMSWSRAGLIRNVGTKKSVAKPRNGGLIRVWQGVVAD